MREQYLGKLKHCPHCGCELALPPGKPRSDQQRRRLFALVKALYHNWPERHEFQPKSQDRLRYWLTHKAGWSDILKQVPLNTTDVHLIYGAMKAALDYTTDDKTFVELEGRTIYVHRAHSIAYEEMSQREFARLCTAIDEVIEAETGLKPKELLREAQRVA